VSSVSAPKRAVAAPKACLIGGAWEEGQDDQVFAVIDPATEQQIAELVPASAAQADRAIAAARKAFDDGRWASLSPIERSTRMHDLADRFESEAEYFADLLVSEIGSPRQLVRAVQVDSAIELLRWFADAAVTGPRPGYEEALPLHRRPISSASLLRQEPAGVVAGITPYNFPLLQLMRKLAAALAAGCTMVILPSPRAPLSTIEFMRLFQAGEFPAGVANLVIGGPQVGVQLTTNPMVDMVSFTGSRAVGEAVMAQAARGIKKVVLELGGKSPNIVLPGADVEAAVKPSLLRFSLNAGQGCGATTRTFVPQDDYERYVAEARNVLQDLPVGDPHDEITMVGPVIRKEQQAFVQGHVDRALNSGGTIEAESREVPETGYFLKPLLIGGIGNDAAISQEELFGPVGLIMPFTTIDQAVELANDTRFGLNANIWGPVPDCMDIARRLRTGNVTINGGGGLRHDVPWGGHRESGIGREGGEAGFREFFETKHIQWPV
jgi:aldehyde dehydrogenase (NAD+)